MIKMAYTIDMMAEKGKKKLIRKMDKMKKHYENAIDYAIRRYERLPFGPTIKKLYAEAMKSYAAENYKSKMTPEVAEKWAIKWKQAMLE